jgi:hypothetical protein
MTGFFLIRVQNYNKCEIWQIFYYYANFLTKNRNASNILKSYFSTIIILNFGDFC